MVYIERNDSVVDSKFVFYTRKSELISQKCFGRRSVIHVLWRSPLELLGIVISETSFIVELNYNLNILEFNFLHVLDMPC